MEYLKMVDLEPSLDAGGDLPVEEAASKDEALVEAINVDPDAVITQRQLRASRLRGSGVYHSSAADFPGGYHGS